MKRAQIHVSYAIRTEGGLLPVDLLQSIQDKKTTLDGLKPEQYHLAGEKINDAIGRAWNRALALWDSFSQARAGLPEGDLGTSVTRDKWLLPLFAELGYGRLQPAKAFEINGKVFPISHVWQKVPIHTLGCKLELDHRTEGARGASRSIPHSMLQEFLNNNDDFLWGILTNGLKLRLLRDSVSLTRQAYLEFDLEAIMEGELFADFAIFWLLCHQSRLEAEKPSDFWLEKWSKSAKDIGTRALDQLRGGVETAISELGRGFLRHPANQDLRKKLRDGVLSKEEYYRQLLRLVYRFIFFCVAEERDVLLSPSTTQAQKEKYYQYYAVGRLRRIAEKIRGSNHADLYESFRLLCQLVSDKGLPELGLNPLGSFLFSANTAPDVESCKISNKDFLKAVYALSVITENNVVRHVDYKSLRSEELGSVYEALLELHPDLNIESSDFNLKTVAGSERRTTGSYYTPDPLVQCLLDSTLEPVITERIKGKSKQDAEKLILSLKVCDPACGSGHFLIGAAHRIARRLAAVRSGELEPSPQESRKALRDAINHCLYGVDINPMSVELCKLALWMEALDSGKPLSFLEHRVKCGNSLIGATPKLITDGIPDGAFAPIEGDEKKYCSTFRKHNKEEIKQAGLFDQSGGVWSIARDLGKASYNVGELTNETFAEVKIQETKYKEVISSEAYKTSRFISDSWCAAFVIDKSGRLEYPITNDVLHHLKTDVNEIPGWLKTEIENLTNEYKFFHWHIEFPEVFTLPQEGIKSDNENAGWSGGFDCVLGNPPWERVKLQEKEWFAERNPEIANATKASARKKLIEELKKADPDLHKRFLQDSRKAEGESHFLRNSNRYPLCGCGDINLYAVFAEEMRNLLSIHGRTGAVLPTGIATDDTTKFFFQDLVNSKSIISLFDFENKLLIFPAVAPIVKFCLFTVVRGPQSLSNPAVFVFFAHRIEDILDTERRFQLTPAEIALLNPNTYTCPIFRSNRDAEITKSIYRRVPILIKEGPEEKNLWGIAFTTMFHMSNDSHLFRTKEQLEGEGYQLDGNIFQAKGDRYLPLYEAKLFHQFNHRQNTFDGIPEKDRFKMRAPTVTSSSQQLKDAGYAILPRFWVQQSHVEKAVGAAPLDKFFLVFRGMTNVMTNSRNTIFSAIPQVAVGNSSPICIFKQSGIGFAFLGAVNSFVLDYVTRQKLGGGNMNFFIVNQLPILPPDIYNSTHAPFDKRDTLKAWLLPRVLELTYTAWDLKSFALDCGYTGSPFCWDDERRFLLRSELDAAFFHLYLGTAQEWLKQPGALTSPFPTPRHAVEYILETFPIVKRKDEEKHGEYRTKRVILEIYDEMAEAIKTGVPYKTRLNPAPADPSIAHKA